MISPERRKNSKRAGDESESRFVTLAESRGLTVKKATEHENMYYHIDFHVPHNGRDYSVDVKGKNYPREIWVEFKNVHGNDGWLKGRATHIAFDMATLGKICFVERNKLLDWCNSNVADEFVDEKRDAYRKKYTRRRFGRDDVITKIHIEDLESIPSYSVWEYEKR